MQLAAKSQGAEISPDPRFDHSSRRLGGPAQAADAKELGRAVQGGRSVVELLSPTIKSTDVAEVTYESPLKDSKTQGSVTAKKGGSRKQRRSEQGSNSGPLSFLLTTMPEITDIGFRRPLRFMRDTFRLPKPMASNTASPVSRAKSMERAESTPNAAYPIQKTKSLEAKAASSQRRGGALQDSTLPPTLATDMVKTGGGRPASAGFSAAFTAPAKDPSPPAAEEESRLQELVDRGPLKRSPAKRQGSSDWLYSTMPAATSLRMPDNIHMLHTTANRTTLSTATPGTEIPFDLPQVWEEQQTQEGCSMCKSCFELCESKSCILFGSSNYTFPDHAMHQTIVALKPILTMRSLRWTRGKYNDCADPVRYEEPIPKQAERYSPTEQPASLDPGSLPPLSHPAQAEASSSTQSDLEQRRSRLKELLSSEALKSPRDLIGPGRPASQGKPRTAQRALFQGPSKTSHIHPSPRGRSLFSGRLTEGEDTRPALPSAIMTEPLSHAPTGRSNEQLPNEPSLYSQGGVSVEALARESLISSTKTEPLPGSSIGRSLGTEGSRHPLVQHISPVSQPKSWTSISLPPSARSSSLRTSNSLPEPSAQPFLSQLSSGASSSAVKGSIKEALASGLGRESLEAGLFEGQIGRSGVEGVGVLSKEDGGSYAGRVRRLQPHTRPCSFAAP